MKWLRENAEDVAAAAVLFIVAIMVAYAFNIIAVAFS